MNPIKVSASNEPIQFGNAALGTYRHACALFEAADEEYRVLLPFIQEGPRRGEKAFHIREALRHMESGSHFGKVIMRR